MHIEILPQVLMSGTSFGNRIFADVLWLSKMKLLGSDLWYPKEVKMPLKTKT